MSVVVSLAMLTVYFREAESGPMHSVQGATASVLHPFQVGAERVAVTAAGVRVIGRMVPGAQPRGPRSGAAAGGRIALA